MKTAFKWLRTNWPLLILAIISAAIMISVCFINLASITNGKLSQPEVTAIKSASSGKLIWQNPLFLPYKLVQYGIIKSGFASVYLLRAGTVIFGVILVFLFYLLAKKWFSSQIAWLASLMLLTSSLFLNFSRLAVTDILLPLGLIGLLWSVWWVFESKYTNITLIFAVFILAFSLYIPGLIWFTILIAFMQRRHLTSAFRRTSTLAIFCGASIVTLLLLPLMRAFMINSALIREWLGLPTNFSIPELVHGLINVPASLVFRAPFNPVFNLGRLPYLDIFTICLIIIGTYAFLIRHNLVRTRALIGATIIAWLLIALQSTIQINLLLPLVYIMVAAGIMFMLQQWYSVFPKNPIARTVGLLLLVSVVSISVYYNSVRYFIAWANNPISQQAFHENLPTNLVQ